MPMKRNFFVYHVTGSTYSRIVFGAMCVSRIYTKLWKELKKSICIRVYNFAKSVNF